MVAYERWSLLRGSKYSDLTGKLADESWLLMKGGGNRRFNCNSKQFTREEQKGSQAIILKQSLGAKTG